MFFYLSKVKKILLCLILIMLMSGECFSNPYLGQGKNLSDDVIKKVECGMLKSRLVELLGNPTLTFSCNVDCLCYYYHYIPSNCNLKIVRRCVLLFFENDVLISHKMLY